MKRTPWFERKFPVIEDNGVLPDILERLEGTAARLRYKLQQASADLSAHEAGKWSIKKEIGHLIDLEPLWYERMQQFLRDETELIKADLSNRKTHEADHDSHSAEALIDQFEAERRRMLALLRALPDEALERMALHPRLRTPMRIVDLAYFVAEHDDHHLAQITHLLTRYA